MLTAAQVLVTIGTPCSLSAVGSTETYQAHVARAPELVGFAAFDAGLVEFANGGKDTRPQFVWAQGVNAGQPATLEDVTPAIIDAYFVPRGTDELVFPAREG